MISRKDKSEKRTPFPKLEFRTSIVAADWMQRSLLVFPSQSWSMVTGKARCSLPGIDEL